MDSQSLVTLITTLIAGLGLGSGITALIQYNLKIKEASYQDKQQALAGRYKVIILLMYAAHDFDSNKASLRINRPDLKTKDDVIAELYAEWINMLLFASKETLHLLRQFIEKPSIENLVQCAASMRVDLGRGKLELEDIRTIKDTNSERSTTDSTHV